MCLFGVFGFIALFAYLTRLVSNGIPCQNFFVSQSLAYRSPISYSVFHILSVGLETRNSLI